MPVLQTMFLSPHHSCRESYDAILLNFNSPTDVDENIPHTTHNQGRRRELTEKEYPSVKVDHRS